MLFLLLRTLNIILTQSNKNTLMKFIKCEENQVQSQHFSFSRKLPQSIDLPSPVRKPSTSWNSPGVAAIWYNGSHSLTFTSAACTPKVVFSTPSSPSLKKRGYPWLWGSEKGNWIPHNTNPCNVVNSFHCWKFFWTSRSWPSSLPLTSAARKESASSPPSMIHQVDQLAGLPHAPSPRMSKNTSHLVAEVLHMGVASYTYHCIYEDLWVFF